MERKSWQKTALRWLIVSFILILAPIYALLGILYVTGLDTLRTEISAAMESQVSYLLDSLDGEISRIRALESDLIIDPDINRLAAIPQSLDMIEKIFSMRRVQNRLFAIKNSSELIRDATVMIPAIGRQISPGSVSELDAASFAALCAIPASLDREVSRHDGRLFLLTQYPLPYTSTSRRVQYLIVVELSIPRIQRVLEELAGEGGSGVIFADRGRGMLLAAGAATDIGADAQWAVLDGAYPGRNAALSMTVDRRRYLSVSRASAAMDAVLCKLIPEDEIFMRLRRYQAWFYLCIAMAVVVIVVYSLNTYSFIHRPLSRLAAAFKRVEKGEFDIAISHAHDDEFRYIYRQFNGMAANLKTLVDQAYNQKLLVQRAEMRQLQSQINPHFLYNAFFMLNTMVRTGDVEALETITQKLGQYFRFITKNTEDVVDLSEEVRYAGIYADIQAMRFSNRVTLRFDGLPEGFAGLKVPRLILQPVIENAFEHGLGKSAAGGALTVAFAPAADGIDIAVENGGAVLSDSELETVRGAIRGEAAEDEPTALANIHQRLRLKFGPGAGLSAEKGSEGGLRVTIRLRGG